MVLNLPIKMWPPSSLIIHILLHRSPQTHKKIKGLKEPSKAGPWPTPTLHGSAYPIAASEYWLLYPLGPAVPGSQAHQHLKFAVLADVPRRVVDCGDKAAEVASPCVPVFLWDYIILF